MSGFLESALAVRAPEHPVGLPVEDETKEADRENDKEPCHNVAQERSAKAVDFLKKKNKNKNR